MVIQKSVAYISLCLIALSNFGCISLFSASSSDRNDLANAEEKPPAPTMSFSCRSAREFIVTYNFLTEAEVVAISKDESQKIAERVAAGCDGAARRFVEVVTLLSKAKLGASDTIEWGIKLALASHEQSDAFVEVFKRAYLPNYLDLDIHAALNLAESLALTFNGSSSQSQKDFQALVEGCIDADGFDLPKPKCAELAARITRLGEAPRKPIADEYFDAVNFLTKDDDGPQLTLVDAMNSAEELLTTSPLALKNFRDTYLFATSDHGLNLDRSAAVNQAKAIAKLTRRPLPREANN